MLFIKPLVMYQILIKTFLWYTGSWRNSAYTRRIWFYFWTKRFSYCQRKRAFENFLFDFSEDKRVNNRITLSIDKKIDVIFWTYEEITIYLYFTSSNLFISYIQHSPNWKATKSFSNMISS
jgi:hypothetical protein